jgi:hypothetical protein
MLTVSIVGNRNVLPLSYILQTSSWDVVALTFNRGLRMHKKNNKKKKEKNCASRYPNGID